MRFSVAALVIFLLPSFALADPGAICVRDYYAKLKNGGPALAIAPSDAQMITTEVSRSIALQDDIQAISCTYINKAQAWESRNQVGVSDGIYILYHPDWFREVIGDDRVQTIAIFGHELGHIYNGHFDRRKSISQERKEAEADLAAGCAVGRLAGDLPKLENLMSRIRTESGGGGYPSRKISIEAAQVGFKNCYRPRSNFTTDPTRSAEQAPADIFKEPSGRKLHEKSVKTAQ